MKIALTFICFLFVNITFTQINYLESFDLALKKAKEEDKLVFVKYYGETCSHCQKLQEILNVDSISSLYNKNFISVKINAENLQAKDLEFINKYNFNIEGVPYMLFFKNDGKFIHFTSPKLDHATVANVVATVLNPEKRTESLPAKYKAGARDMYTLKMYSKLSQMQGNDSLTIHLSNEIFANFNKDLLLNENSIYSVDKYVITIDNGLFKFWMDNYAKLDSVSPNIVLKDKEKVFEDVLMRDINTNKGKWNLEQLNLAKKYLKIAHFKNPYSFTWEEEIQIYLKKNQEKEAIEVIKDLLENSDFEMSMYALKSLISKVKQAESFVKIENLFPAIDKKYMSKENISQIYLSKLLLYKVSKDEIKFNKFRKEVESYFISKNFSLDLIDEILK